MTAQDEIDLLAAEFVLGTLDADERAATSRRLPSDRVLARAVEGWQARLSPLSEATPAVEPSKSLFRAIEARLFGARSNLRRLRYWQASTGIFAATAAALAAWVVVLGHPGQPSSPDRLVAVLQKDAGAPAMVLDVDLKTRRLTVRSLAPAPPADRSYELWLIDAAAGAPRPLGLVSARAPAEATLGSFDPAVISGATYAVTLEPVGGSPDGKPSGTPILVGKLVSSPP